MAFMTQAVRELAETTDVRSSALALAASIRSCPLARGQRLEDCFLLSPSFTGSGTARRALQRVVNLPRNRHSSTLQTVRAENVSAPCFIMTLRDPLERIESGVRYRIMTNATWNSSLSNFTRKAYPVVKQLQTADSLLLAWRNPTHPLHEAAKRLALSSNPPRMQADMLRGHTCGLTTVRVLCTPSLLDDLGDLGRSFGVKLPLTASVPRPRAAAAFVHSTEMRKWFSCSAAAEDTWLFYELCGAGRSVRPCDHDS